MSRSTFDVHKILDLCMDILRKAIVFSLGFAIIGLFNAWQQDYPKVITPTPASYTQPVVDSQQVTPAKVVFSASSIPIERQITFETDVIKGAIDRQGGHLIYLTLLDYSQSVNTKDKSPIAFVLLDHSVNRYYIAQTDLLKPGESPGEEKKRLYQSDKNHYTLSSNQEAVYINLRNEEDGVVITKQFTVKKSHYQIDINYYIRNNGQETWKAQPYAQLSQRSFAKAKGWFSAAAYNEGVVSSDTTPYEKVSFKTTKQRLPNNTQQGWLSFIEPYFAAVWISKLPTVSYYTHALNNMDVLGMLGNDWEVLPGETLEGNFSFYAGPKIVQSLQKSAKHLELLVDHGIFWSVATVILWFIDQFYLWVGNWGWATVLLAVLVKVCLYRLSARELRASFAVRKLQPRVNALKLRYGNDQKKMDQATAELYRREGVSASKFPLTGLLQIPIQMPLYKIVSGSIVFRQAPFFWINDLSTADLYYGLPILFGFTMFIDQFIERQILVRDSKDSVQVSTLLMVPIFSALLFSIFKLPAGLMLYLLAQNMLSTLQKWWLLGMPGFPDISRLYSRG